MAKAKKLSFNTYMRVSLVCKRLGLGDGNLKDCDIAKHYRVTKQYVSGLKKRALKHQKPVTDKKAGDIVKKEKKEKIDTIKEIVEVPHVAEKIDTNNTEEVIKSFLNKAFFKNYKDERAFAMIVCKVLDMVEKK